LESGWNTDQRTLLSKFDNSSSLREWRVYIDTNYRIYAEKRGNGTGGTTTALVRTNSNVLSGIDDKWIHICVVWLPAGPNSADAFTEAKAYIYVNGKLNVDTQSEQPSGPYTGMTDTAGTIRIGSRQSADYWDGEIRDVKLFNKELSLAEVREVYSNGQLPESFAESTGTASLNNSTFANSTTSSRQFGTITGASATGFTAAYNNANTNNRIAAPLSSDAIKGKKYKATFTVNTDGADVILRFFNAATLENTGLEVATINTTTATAVSYEWTETGSGDRIGFLDNSPAASGNLVVSSFRIIQIGSVLDARAEQFDTSTGKLYDLSGNSFVGTQSGGVSLLGREFPVYETGSFTPTVEFGGASSGTYSVQEAGYRRIGNTVSVWGQINHSSKSAATGSATIEGLPFSSAASSNTPFAGVVGMFNAANLTSQVVCLIVGSSTSLGLYDNGATGTTALDDTNFGSGTIIRFSITYQIS
jgi:hypothetical protein